jgi:outer membrane protein OmpA-like peptidoglycan-associated protein
VWTLQAPPNKNAWNSVAFGNGTFVAVGPSTNGDGIMRSTDGKNWIASTGVPNNTWTSVTYGNGIFVAVASTGVGNRIMWSKDGAKWTVSETSRDLNWGLVKFGNGVFVAAVKGVLRLQAVLAYSSDGITWKTPTYTIIGRVVPSQALTTLGFGNGTFVVTGSSNVNALGWQPLLMTSRDGENWIWDFNTTLGTSTAVAFQTYGCETFVGINGVTGFINATKNPLRWPRADYPQSPLTGSRKNLNSGTFAGGLFVTVGNGISTLSNNALLWRAQVLRNANNWSSVAYGNGTFVAVASSGADHRVMTAPYTPLALSRASETIAVGSAIVGTSAQFTGCATPNYSISPSVAGTGLSFNSTTGELSGTPTVATSETIYTISAIDGSEVPASATFALTVTAAAPSTENTNSSSGSTTTPGSTTPTTPKPETSTADSGTPQTPATENNSTGTTPPPNPPAAPTSTQSAPLRLKVYFDMASYALTTSNRTKLLEFAKKVAELGKDVTITVTGYAQPTPGSESTDDALSLNRATRVTKLLTNSGVTSNIIAKGAGRAKLNLPKSRYVEIVVNNSK